MTDREKLTAHLWEAWAYAEEMCGSIACRDCPASPKDAKCMTVLAADHLLANGVTVQRWIPVTERLPDEDGYYLTLRECGYVGSRYFYKDNPNHFTRTHSMLTHWMPLPEPPKEGE